MRVCVFFCLFHFRSSNILPVNMLYVFLFFPSFFFNRIFISEDSEENVEEKKANFPLIFLWCASMVQFQLQANFQSHMAYFCKLEKKLKQKENFKNIFMKSFFFTSYKYCMLKEFILSI